MGFTLQPGSGQSEYLTVYGGLELALGLMFLWPLVRPSETAYTLFLCLLIHGCLVAFRTAGFITFAGIPTTTCALAATEWSSSSALQPCRGSDQQTAVDEMWPRSRFTTETQRHGETRRAANDR